jgi:hypothetical protein
MNLPKAKQNLDEWQTAIGCLIGAAEGRDFMTHRGAARFEPQRRTNVYSS